MSAERKIKCDFCRHEVVSTNLRKIDIFNIVDGDIREATFNDDNIFGGHVCFKCAKSIAKYVNDRSTLTYDFDQE